MKKTLRNIKTTFLNMDKVLFFSTLILIVFGTLNIVTASSREAVVNANANMFHFFFKHMFILIAGLVAFLILIFKIDTKKYKGWMLVIFPIVVVLNGYLVIKGGATRGASNWIDLKFLKVQPSEFAKPILIISMGVLFHIFNKRLTNKKIKNTKELGIILAVSLVFPVLVYLQKDLGTAMILVGIIFVEFLFSPIKREDKSKVALTAIVALSLILLVRFSITGYILSNAQQSRLNNFFNPCSKYEDTGYQVCNAFIAINNGGLFGVGIGKSTQKYSYIPEPHTDMVFAIIAEEYGLLVCAAIFILYIIILLRILILARKTKCIQNKYICLGVGTYIFLHIFINLGGLFGVIPLTGVPLPFLSYGGSFTLSLIASLGVIQRIHIEMKSSKSKK